MGGSNAAEVVSLREGNRIAGEGLTRKPELASRGYCGAEGEYQVLAMNWKRHMSRL